ncbi:MAG: hypothetical protein QM634_10180, partial [Gordonia sp. (in: high G+C Gram-positive bacteria)]
TNLFVGVDFRDFANPDVDKAELAGRTGFGVAMLIAPVKGGSVLKAGAKASPGSPTPPNASPQAPTPPPPPPAPHSADTHWPKSPDTPTTSPTPIQDCCRGRKPSGQTVRLIGRRPPITDSNWMLVAIQ